MKKLTIMDWHVVRAYADCNMNASAAARVVHMHINNVEYHLEKVKRLTGLNPKCFYDLVELMRVGENNG